jgi:nitrite reductase/ring-hydroxylating ferredoxin subunit
MIIALSNITVDHVRRSGVVNVVARGIPLSIVTTPEGSLKAYVRICPHAWVEMPQPMVSNNCLVCPLHAVTFDVCTGNVDNSRGKHVAEGLREVRVEVRHDIVFVHLDAGDYLYLVGAQARRTGRAGKHVRKSWARLIGGAR